MALLGGRTPLSYIFQELRLLRLVGQGRCPARTAGVFSGGEVSEGRGKTVQVSVSSLRIDAVAAAGLDISRQKIWEAALDNNLMLNGKVVNKKSSNVSEGDIIEVDTILSRADGDTGEGEIHAVVRRGRVEVVEIGGRTRRGGYQMTLTRYKHHSKYEVT